MNKFILAVLFIMSTVSTAYSQTVVESTTKSDSDITTKGRTVVISPPPSAISPSVNSSSSDLCTVGVAGAVQTQILGISTGEAYRDMNCERLKISKTLYDMGMKVAAVSVLCQDRRTFDAMTSEPSKQKNRNKFWISCLTITYNRSLCGSIESIPHNR